MTAIALALAALLLFAAIGCAGPEKRRAGEPVVVHHYVQDPWPYWGLYPHWGVVERRDTVYVPVQPQHKAPAPRRRILPPKRLHVR